MRQGLQILTPALPFTAMDPRAGHFPSLGLSVLPCEVERVGLMGPSSLQGSELGSQAAQGSGAKPELVARLEGDVTEKGRDIILVQKKVHQEVTEEKDGETEA